MKCFDDDTLLAYKNKCLDADTILQVELHIESCLSCRTLLLSWMRAENAAVLEDMEDTSAESGSSESFDSLLRGGLNPLPLSRGVSVGRYLVLQHIGSGAMGVVFTAYDPELNRKVALKLLRPDFCSTEPISMVKARLRREAQAMAKVSHTNVVSVYDLQVTDRQLVIAMEYVEGETLQEWLCREDRTWREVLEIFQQAAEGLAAIHDKGLVHRDFKPANVLIGIDGRACVTDFGLVCRTGNSDPFNNIISTKLNESDCDTASEMTKTGMLLGTPAYMSPEQMEGKEANTLSDQFGFCIALWEALYGERPFTGSTIEELRAHRVEGGLMPPRGTKAPSWVRAVVTRGLSIEAEQRFPTMHELRNSLAQNRKDQKRRRWALYVLTTFFIGAVVTQFHYWSKQNSVCKGAEQKLAGVWDAAKKKKVKQTFIASGRSYAEDTYTRVEDHLNSWSSAWIKNYKETCEATHFKGFQTEEVLEQRMRCLKRKLENLVALVNVFVERSAAEVVDKAVQGTLSLGNTSFCSEVEVLGQNLPLPKDGEIRKTTENLWARLADVRQRDNLGQYREAEKIITKIKPRVNELGYLPLDAELAMLEGQNLQVMGKYTLAEAKFKEALRLGLEMKHWRVAFWGALGLVYVVGYKMQRHNEGLAFAQTALGLSQVLSAEHKAWLVNHVGIILSEQGKYREAEAKNRQALALREKALGPRHPAVAGSLNNLGIVLEFQGRYAEAESYHRRALTLWKRAFGARHPAVAESRNNIAMVLLHQGRHKEALVESRLALEIRLEAFGQEHPAVAESRNTIATVLHHQGDQKKAETECRLALKMRLEAFGPEHPSVSQSRNVLGKILKALGKYKQAAVEHQRAFSIAKRTIGLEHPQVAEILLAQGDLFWDTRNFKQAEKAFGQVLSICEKSRCKPISEATARFGMARVALRQGKEDYHVIVLAKKAREGYARLGQHAEISKIDTWLNAHRDDFKASD